jgi:CRISPR-associated protein Cas2
MKAEEVRFMWLFCFFDLPVGSKAQRRAATSFRKHLKSDGFIMLQWSVYARLCRGDEGSDKHVERLRSAMPSEGSIRCLRVTDKQYARMRIMLGTANKTEQKGADQLVLL